MTTEKTCSDAEANLQNPPKGTGPRTPRGKSHSRRNALKHGFYSRELLVSEADAPELEALRRQLEAQLKPATPMQWLAFDNVVTCAWRPRSAIRLESPLFAIEFQACSQDRTEAADAEVDPHLVRWYASSRLDLRAGVKSLERASAEFSALGRLRDETKDFLSRAFGPDFVDTLTQWTPLSKTAVLMADML
jgi:hypothetical protein